MIQNIFRYTTTHDNVLGYNIFLGANNNALGKNNNAL